MAFSTCLNNNLIAVFIQLQFPYSIGFYWPKLQSDLSKPYMHIPQSLVRPMLRTHRIEASSGISSVRHRKHLEKKKNNTDKTRIKSNSNQKLVSLKFSKLLNLPFSIQSISLRDSVSTGISFLIFISVINVLFKIKFNDKYQKIQWKKIIKRQIDGALNTGFT